jgi:hypothetical protein
MLGPDGSRVNRLLDRLHLRVEPENCFDPLAAPTHAHASNSKGPHPAQVPNGIRPKGLDGPGRELRNECILPPGPNHPHIPHFSVAFAQMAVLQLQSLQTCCESFSHNIFLSGVLIPDDFQLLFYMTAVSETRHAAEPFQRTSTSTTYVKTPAKGFFVQIKLLTGVR